MIRRYLPWIALAALCSTPAFAASPTFSYLDLAYVRAKDDADGAAVRASAAIGSLMFMQLDSAKRDHQGGSVEYVSLGGGMHWPISDGIEAAFAVSADWVAGAFEGPPMSDTGAGMEVRWVVALAWNCGRVSAATWNSMRVRASKP
jgi:hypothetical protein